MDEARISRFITPSIFFLASLLLGAYLNGQICLTSFKELSPESTALIAGVTATSLFPLGFIITAVFIIILRFTCCIFGKSYQISLSKDALEKVWPALNLNDELEKTTANKIYAGITFDHEILHERVHAAVVRLWNAFNIAAASSTALILALLVRRFVLDIKWTWAWLSISVCLLLLFISVAVITWRDTMGLLEFQTYRNILNIKPKEN